MHLLKVRVYRLIYLTTHAWISSIKMTDFQKYIRRLVNFNNYWSYHTPLCKGTIPAHSAQMLALIFGFKIT